jgi:hypothetical protein
VQIRTIPELEPELEQVINVFNPWLAIEVNTTRYGGNHNPAPSETSRSRNRESRRDGVQRLRALRQAQDRAVKY